MGKKFYPLAAAALVLASCANDEFLGEGTNQSPSGSSNVIAFGSQAPNITRAGESLTGKAAAEKLNKQFIVYGEKSESSSSPFDGTKVFDNYFVKYTASTAGTSESNTQDWEYVGNWTNYGSTITGYQTIKYWDFSATNYVFSAVSARPTDLGKGDVIVEKITSPTDPVSVYGKGWKLALSGSATLDDIYISDRWIRANSTNTDNTQNHFGGLVNLTFRALASKIRFGIFEKVPGYSVKIDKVYYTKIEDGKWANSEANFYINGGFKNIGGTVANVDVVYYNNDEKDVNNVPLENQPKVTVSGGEPAPSKQFGTNLMTATKIGVDSPSATFDQDGGAYTTILPNPTNTQEMVLYVDYTLISTDGSGEKIKVWHAKAVVPQEYCKWKPNFAYTYLFKISNNTNGSTTPPTDPLDPNDPTDDPNPQGLYPITFDAVVVTDQIGDQQTITTVATPSITTYANGVDVTDLNEYEANTDVYVAVADGTGTTVTLTTANAKLYRAYQIAGNEEITEKTVEHYAFNGIILEPVPFGATTGDVPSIATSVPLADVSSLTFAGVMKFTPREGEVYVAEYTDNSDQKHYKVIKVAGTVGPHDYSLSPSSATISDVITPVTLTLTDNTLKVLGNEKHFVVKKDDVESSALTITAGANAGEYNVNLNQEGIKAGTIANGGYTVDFGGKSVTITVNLTYKFSSAAVTVVGGNSEGYTITLTDASSNAIDGAVIDLDSYADKLEVTNSSNNNYKIVAKPGASAGVYIVKIAGQNVTVTVTGYTLSAPSTSYDKVLSQNVTVVFSVKEGSTDKDGLSDLVVVTKDGSIVTPIVTNTSNAGEYQFTVTDGGVYKVSYNGYESPDITVNAYTMELSVNTISSENGGTTATIKANGTVVNAAESDIVILNSTSDVVTSKFTITKSGNLLVIKRQDRTNCPNGDYTINYKKGTSNVYATAPLKLE